MAKYKTGDIVTACVTGIEKYGIFVNIDNKYDGLIHISEITSSYVRNINDYAKIGEIIRAKVIEEEKIIETSKGFRSLQDNLEEWVNNKISEISQK